ncbi:MAG: S9 family peptidase [Deltaproteobacteria bacterium]|nr:S9 family peptidase [Deltaproteobacteria bacterium]
MRIYRHLIVVTSVSLLCVCAHEDAKAPPSVPPTEAHATTNIERVTRSPAPAPPVARRDVVVETIHGVKVADPYRWLEKIDGAGVRGWLSAHNAHARWWLKKRPDRAALQARLEELSYVETASAPRKRGKRYFYSRRPKKKEKTVYYFREGKEGQPQVLLDPNTLSKDGSVSVRGLSVAWNGEKVAYKLSQNAADEATLYVMDVATRKTSKIDTITGAKYAQPSWSPKSDGFYYTRLPTDAKIPVADRPGFAAVYYHRLGTDPRKDTLIHDKTGDPGTFIHADISRDGRYLFFYVFHGWSKTDLYYKDLRRHRKFKKLAVGLDAKFGVYAWKQRFYLWTNDRAPNYRLYRIDPRKTQRRQWEEIVPERKDAVLRDFTVVGQRLALQYLKNASSELRLARLNGKLVRTIELPGIGSASNLVGDPDRDEAYFTYSSFITPRTIYETSVKKGGRKVHFKVEVAIDASKLAVRQVWYPSKDGTKVSMFIVGNKGMPRDGSTGFVLYGYGGFDVSITPYFRPENFVLFEAGGALALPNLRGGGEYGESWHQAGMLTQKQNVFDDFIAAAQYLIAEGYTKSERLAIRGGSNGGLLVGAAMVQRPELFAAVSCHVPLLDMVRYHLFGSGKTWIPEYGSAADEEQFKALYAYSPYHHLEPAAYPALLMNSADGDDRVDPLHARKFVAALRYANRGSRPVLLRVESKAGHGGGDMVRKRVARLADEFSFLFSQLKLRFPRGK